jgi:hypothetical protein
VIRDLKIELRDLFGLHSVSLELEHAVRQGHEGAWQAFSPSRFVYAFFTFNSIYSWDWAKSFRENQVLAWDPIIDAKSNKTRPMREYERFGTLLDFYYATLDTDTSALVATQVNEMLNLFGISDPQAKLGQITTTNEDDRMKQYRLRFPQAFATTCEPEVATDKHHEALSDALNFVYRVRCNIFHGTKTTIHMRDPEQQSRLLIYTAVLIATNSLLFEIAGRAGIRWETPHLIW